MGLSTPSPAVAFGDDTLVLLGDDSGQSSTLAITRVDGDGGIVTAPYYILRAPMFRIGISRHGPPRPRRHRQLALVRRRRAWVGLARITP